MPLTFRPLCQRSEVYRIAVQDIMPQMAVMLETRNHLLAVKPLLDEIHGLQYPNAVPADPVAAAMKDKSEKAPPKRTQTHGNPVLFVLRKILGACPRYARPYNAREEMNRSAIPADHALVTKAAFMIDGRTLIPAFLMAMTNGLFAAAVPRLRDGSVGETNRPITNALQR